MPTLWRHVDLSLAQRGVSGKSLKEYILRGKRLTTHVTIHRVAAEPSDLYKFIVGRCPKLESLDLISGLSNASLVGAISMASKLTHIKLWRDRGISLDAVTEILGKCTHLTSAEFHGVETSGTPAQWRGDLSRLRRLVLKHTSVRTPMFQNLMKSNELLYMVPQLEELTLATRDSSFATRLADLPAKLPALRKLDVSNPNSDGTYNCNIQDLIRLPPGLRSGAFGAFVCRGGVMSPSALADIKALAWEEHFQELTMLSFVAVSFQLTVALDLAGRGPLHKVLLTNNGILERLCFGHCLHGNHFDAVEMAAHLVTIRALWANGQLRRLSHFQLQCQSLDDDTLESLARDCPCLESVDVSGCCNITGVGVKALVTKQGTKLARLDVTSCAKIGFDAIEWARSQGVQVVAQAKEGRAGRKVRYR